MSPLGAYAKAFGDSVRGESMEIAHGKGVVLIFIVKHTQVVFIPIYKKRWLKFEFFLPLTPQ
jgi:hypothetical protein